MIVKINDKTIEAPEGTTIKVSPDGAISIEMPQLYKVYPWHYYQYPYYVYPEPYKITWGTSVLTGTQTCESHIS